VSLSIVAIFVFCVLVFWALGAYNRLVRLRSEVARRLQALVAVWHTQAQSVRARLEQFAQGRETESQWALLNDEALSWRPLAMSARQFLACLAVLQAKPQQIAVQDDLSAVIAAHDIFFTNWLRLQDAQPDLAGASMPPDLQVIWAQHQPLIAERLRDYNQAVQTYQLAIGQFPALLLAWIFGFGKTSQLEPSQKTES
jgi:LemA protein